MNAPSGGAEGAADFFRRRGLDRVAGKARAAFWRNGGPAGTIVLDDATPEEHNGLSSLIGRPPGHGALRVRLIDLDNWLQQSGFHCSLEDALTAYAGERPGSRAAERSHAQQEVARARDRWRQMLEQAAEGLPPDAGGRRWLVDGAHGIPWLLRRFQPGPDAALPEKRALVRTVAAALSQLPLGEPRRLAVFANDLAGSPHALDPDQEAGRLLTLGLLDLYGAEAEIDASAGERLSAADRRQLYAHAGLLSETVSSTVAVYNLAAAARRDGSQDPRVTGPPTLQILPLRSLLQWSSVRSALPDVFIVENPAVFEDLVDALEREEQAAGTPTLICTAGWLNLAAWRLLDLLVSTGDVAHFFYSGDFDLAGLRIAGSVRTRYLDRFQPWRLTAEDYRLADRDEGTTASAEELRQLAGLSPDFPDLVPVIQEAGRWAYQEAITTFLLDDLRNASAAW